MKTIDSKTKTRPWTLNKDYISSRRSNKTTKQKEIISVKKKKPQKRILTNSEYEDGPHIQRKRDFHFFIILVSV